MGSKYQKGDRINSLNELFEQEFIYCHHKIYHNGWFCSWPIRLAKRELDRGIYKAIKKDNNMKYKTVTLCGSTRFKDDFIKAQEELTLKEYVVISVGLFGHADNKYDNILTDDIKNMLDDMHKQKIDMADEIYVINKNGYIGDSTRNEIAYAIKTGKKVNYMFNN